MPKYYDERFPIDDALERIREPYYDFGAYNVGLAEEVLFDDPDFFGIIEENGEVNGKNYLAMRNLKFTGKYYSGLIQFDNGVGIFYKGIFNRNSLQFMSSFIDEKKAHLGLYTPIKWELKKKENSRLYKGVQIPQTDEKEEAFVRIEKTPDSILFKKILADIILNKNDFVEI